MTADEDPLGWATFKFTSQLSKYRLCPNNFLNSGSQPLVPVFFDGLSQAQRYEGRFQVPLELPERCDQLAANTRNCQKRRPEPQNPLPSISM